MEWGGQPPPLLSWAILDLFCEFRLPTLLDVVATKHVGSGEVMGSADSTSLFVPPPPSLSLLRDVFLKCLVYMFFSDSRWKFSVLP